MKQNYTKKYESMKVAGEILYVVLQELKDLAKPGVTTDTLDKYAESRILELGGLPSFKGFNGFPSSLCASINHDLVHCIPAKKKLKKGDILSIDLGVQHGGFHTDSAITFGIDSISTEAKNLLSVTKTALKMGIEKAIVGNTTNDIATAIQDYFESKKLSVVRDLVGHGISKDIHESPYIPNFKTKPPHHILTLGQTIAIEPMVTLVNPKLTRSEDGYGYAMADGNISAHFEHTIIILKDGPEVLTTKHDR